MNCLSLVARIKVPKNSRTEKKNISGTYLHHKPERWPPNLNTNFLIMIKHQSFTFNGLHEQKSVYSHDYLPFTFVFFKQSPWYGICRKGEISNAVMFIFTLYYSLKTICCCRIEPCMFNQTGDYSFVFYLKSL